MTAKNLEVHTSIDASPADIWLVVSDLRRMPQWSPQCRMMLPLGTLKEGSYTINMNRQGWKFWPTVSKVLRFEFNRAVSFRTLTNDSVWEFEIAQAAIGSVLTERRLVPPGGTKRFSENIVEHMLGGEVPFDAEMEEGMRTTLAKIKSAIEDGPLCTR